MAYHSLYYPTYTRNSPHQHHPDLFYTSSSSSDFDINALLLDTCTQIKLSSNTSQSSDIQA
ncbi:hypothetical protein M422DRAFT_37131 [Sphaerobolus stellatus SS14]|uniref:Uncharacterized protein n=1 Tax=Sphaerobolus stellatus (strain SS14) TaxID=990650 RepID=A0A0C9UUW0_SPHS4|nr:hypothetical protein M422DRAFT_37131 [Sphaerobolus stellatus SS14]